MDKCTQHAYLFMYIYRCTYLSIASSQNIFFLKYPSKVKKVDNGRI